MNKHNELCPLCGNIYKSYIHQKEFDYPTYYSEYLHKLEHIFGSKKWPVCEKCYFNNVEICDLCGMALSFSPIYWSTTALQDRLDHMCSECVINKTK